MANKYLVMTCLLLKLTIMVSCQFQPPKIVPLTLFNYVDTSFTSSDSIVHIGYLYIVKNYDDNVETQKLIDSFVYALSDTNFKRSTSISIGFYKESSITNPEHLAKNKRDLDRYSQKEDMIYTYYKTFCKNNGYPWIKVKYKNGELDPPSDIIVEDTKLPIP